MKSVSILLLLQSTVVSVSAFQQQQQPVRIATASAFPKQSSSVLFAAEGGDWRRRSPPKQAWGLGLPAPPAPEETANEAVAVVESKSTDSASDSVGAAFKTDLRKGEEIAVEAGGDASKSAETESANAGAGAFNTDFLKEIIDEAGASVGVAFKTEESADSASDSADDKNVGAAFKTDLRKEESTDKSVGAAFKTDLRKEESNAKSDNDKSAKPVDVASLKTDLLEKISTLKRLQEEDGKIKIDFGVKGGELDKKSRAPRKLDYYSISDRVGSAADAIFDSVKKLSEANPTKEATAGLDDKNYDTTTKKAPLDGAWSLLFSTAADANFSKDSNRGEAKAGNIVDAKNGKMTNVIAFAPNVDKDGNETPKAVNELRVKLSAKPEGPNRVNLVFKYVAVKFTRFFFLKLRWTLYIPVPGPTIGNFVIGLSNLKRKLFRKTDEPERKRPKAFFDVLFLDENLRVHKTGEDNLFIQARPEWKAAFPAAA